MPKLHLYHSLEPLISNSKKHIPIVVNPYNTVVTAFFVNPQFNGRYGSSGPSKSTITSVDVFVCDNGCVKGVVCPGSRLRILDTTDWARLSTADRLEDAVVCFSSFPLVVVPLLSCCSWSSIESMSMSSSLEVDAWSWCVIAFAVGIIIMTTRYQTQFLLFGKQNIYIRLDGSCGCIVVYYSLYNNSRQKG